jgi:hypothetical protein
LTAVRRTPVSGCAPPLPWLRTATVSNGVNYSIAIEERCCRGDWAPESEARQAALVASPGGEPIRQLKGIEVAIRDGRGNRRVKLVRSDGPGELAFQLPYEGASSRDGNKDLPQHSRASTMRDICQQAAVVV